MRVVLTGKQIVSSGSMSKDFNPENFKMAVDTSLNHLYRRNIIRDTNITHQDLEKLGDLLSEIESWRDDEFYKKRPLLNKDRVLTVELTYDEKGEVDEDNFQRILRDCADEYIKVRMPTYITSDCLSRLLAKNDTGECRRRECPKTMAEFVV